MKGSTVLKFELKLVLTTMLAALAVVVGVHTIQFGEFDKDFVQNIIESNYNDIDIGYDNDISYDYDYDGEDNNPIDEFIAKETVKGSSLRILLSKLKDYSQPEAYDGVIETQDDIETETDRCARYGYEYNPSITKRRRIFMGSLIANDSWHVIATHAAEAYGLYHTVAFIESNTTPTQTVRETRFDEGPLNYRMLQSGIFGPNTDVYVDFRVDAAKHLPNLDPLFRENVQRSHITQRWKEAGMQPDDIGIICDVDEMFTRDFLLALQRCNVPQFNPGQDCYRPVITGKGVNFQIVPHVSLGPNKLYHHPQAVIGECIDNIGDVIVHKPGRRKYKDNEEEHFIGKRILDDELPEGSMYPLWQPWDFRMSYSNLFFEDGHLHTAYHLHNFMDSFDILKNKYTTFGHGDGHTVRPLSSIPKVQDAIEIIKEQYDNPTGFDNIEGRKPLLWDKLYVGARLKEMMDEIETEESKENTL